MDFGFLFNTQRKVFHIGYNVAGDRLDDNFYDLLASEARLASFLAIGFNVLIITSTIDYFQHRAIALSTSAVMIINFFFYKIIYKSSYRLPFGSNI